MAHQFTSDEWARIRTRLEADPQRYGLPRRRYGSALLASFNIRKLGRRDARNEGTWRFLSDVCRQFDLLAVQEISSDLEGFRYLRQRMGPDFGMVVSDATGAFPGESGLEERLGFIFNWHSVRRTDIATDITYDRSKLLGGLYENREAIQAAFDVYGQALERYREQLGRFERGERASKPRAPEIDWPAFLTFIRAPYCVGFEIIGHPGSRPYQFMAINAHLYYGTKLADRRQEFEALMTWIRERVRDNEHTYFPNFLLMGDLNLDFDNPEADRPKIEEYLKGLNDASGAEVHVNFPFLDVHAGRREVFRTNARHDETFDQIGIFARDARFPSFDQNATLGEDPSGADYGMFDFVTLIQESLGFPPVASMSKDERTAFYRLFEHSVSDHMPIWLRLPLPEAPL